MNTAELKEFVALDEEKAKVKTREKAINSRLEELEASILRQCVDEGIDLNQGFSIRIDGRTIYTHRDIYASAKDGDKEAVILALKACDLSQYVREDYNANSLKAFVREMVREAEEQARIEDRVIDDPASAVPAQLAATLNISTVFSVSSRRS